MTKPVVRFCLGFCVMAGFASAAVAHEIGTTRVLASFSAAGRYQIEVVTDAASLLEKLEAATDAEPTPANAPAALIEARLAALSAVLPNRILLAFDGVPVSPALRIVVEPFLDGRSAPAAQLTLTGAVPPGARTFTWRYAWTFATYALATRPASGAGTTVWLDGDSVSPVLAVAASRGTTTRVETWRQYLVLGFTHILPLGIDHVLFVLGLFLLNSRPRALLAQVSAFTIAHSLTLGLSMYGAVSLPARVVEPAIALSIAYVAIENLMLAELKAWRVWLVFGFGLLHGLGFAGVLAELGLPRDEFLTALLSFNLGVEAAQLTVLAVAFAAVGGWFSARPWYRARIARPASAAIACTALIWAVQRLSA